MTTSLGSAAADIPAAIGRYRIDAKIGEGAMALVYRAHDTLIERRLAIKVLRPELRHNADVVRRFLAESRAAGMLSHANIVTIHDVGEAEGMPYIAMEYLDGEPLDILLEKQGRLTCERVLMLGSQIAAALAFAHRHGVVHRDVKPSNIMICDNGQTVKLLDFGIARIDDLEGAANEQIINRTQFGQVLGTPRYMSPEQAMGMPVDARTDLFSCGSILYEMMTGKPAFDGTGIATLAIQIAQQQQIAIASHVHDCPTGLIYIINKLLAKKADDRFPDAEAVQSALKREIANLGSKRAIERRGLSVRLKMPLALAAVSALALTASVSFLIHHQEQALVDMAVASGSSTTEFIARNAALHVAEIAGLPPHEQDWLPLQSFVEAVANDPNVRWLNVVDEEGVIQASSQKNAVGSPAAYVSGEKAINEVSPEEFRFIRPIQYANANFGSIEMSLSTAKIDTAIVSARFLLFAMAAFVVLAIIAAAYFAACQLTNPLRQLRSALDDISRGQESFRLSHSRRDEFGAIFDAFNRAAAAFDDRGRKNKIDAATFAQTRLEPVDSANVATDARYET